MTKDLYATKPQPAGLKYAKRMVTRKNYQGRVIEVTHTLYNILDITDTDTLLDIGSGLGYISKNFSQIVKHIYCCDINQDLINMAEMNCQHRSNMSFHKITNEPYLNFLKDSSITKAYAHSVLVHCHTTTIINYLKELERVLKPDGLFFFSYCIKSADRNLIQSDKNKIENTIDTLNFNIIKEVEHDWKMFADSVVIELLLSN